jgi:hypothetical protein
VSPVNIWFPPIPKLSSHAQTYWQSHAFHRAELTVRHEENIELWIVLPQIGKKCGDLSVGQPFIGHKEDNLLIMPAYDAPDLSAKIIFNRRQVCPHKAAVIDPVPDRYSLPLVCAPVRYTAMRQINWNTLPVGVLGIQLRLAEQKRNANYDWPRETTHP